MNKQTIKLKSALNSKRNLIEALSHVLKAFTQRFKFFFVEAKGIIELQEITRFLFNVVNNFRLGNRAIFFSLDLMFRLSLSN